MANFPTEGDDTITGTSGADTIDALGGNDGVSGGEGNDTLDGGAGNDAIFGEGGDDVLRISGGGDVAHGGDGFDTLEVNWADEVSGVYNQGFAGYEGGFGTNNGQRYVAWTGIERFVVTTGSGADSFTTGAADDIVSLGAGNDFVTLGAGTNTADGGVDIDGFSANFAAQGAGVSINLTNAVSSGAFGSYSSFEYFGSITGSAFDDVFVTTGVVAHEGIDLGDGNDSATVVAGSDAVVGGNGFDTLIVQYGAETADINNQGFSGYEAGFASVNGARNVRFSGIERFVVTTGSGNDNITTGAADDVVNLGLGNDFATLGAGSNTADGGDGTDGFSADFSAQGAGVSINLQISVSSGAFGSYSNFEYFGSVTGSAFDDMFVTTGVAANEGIDLGDGNDSVTVVAGSDAVLGGLGTDTLIVQYGAETADINNQGFAGYERGFASINGARSVRFSGMDRYEITTGSGNDSITAGALDDIVSLGAGNDFVDLVSGNDQAHGGDGIDGFSANYAARGTGIAIDLQTGASTGNFVSGFEYFGTITGTGFADAFVTTSENRNETLVLGEGNDSATVVNGADIVVGEGGVDTLIVQYGSETADINNQGFAGYEGGYSSINGGRSVRFSGIDRFVITTGSGNDAITTGAGDDVVSLGSGDDFVNLGAGDDQAQGGDGIDGFSADYSARATGIAIDLPAGTSTGNAVTGFEYVGTVTGTAFADVLVTMGQARNETLNLGAGDDRATVVAGGDAVDGGTGNDTLTIECSADDSGIFNQGFAGFESGFGSNNGQRSVRFNGIENIRITTGSAGDTIGTGDGNDMIATGASNDSLNGGGGNDWLDGGAGDDGMTGGRGADTYVIDSVGDVINEGAAAGIDTIRTDLASFDLTGRPDIESLTGTLAGGQALTGNARNNIVSGAAGGDTIAGGDGSDALLGGGGANALTGGQGNDLLGGISTTGGNLVVNGAFETQDGSNSARGFVAAAPEDYNGATYRMVPSLYGWQRATGYDFELNTPGSNPAGNAGDGFVTLDFETHPGQNQHIFQDIAGVAAGTELLLSFAAALPSGGSLGENPTAVLEVIWNGVVIGTIVPASTVMEQYSFIVNAVSTGTGAGGANRLEFREIGGGSDARGTILDKVSLEVLAVGDGADTLAGGTGDDVYVVGAGDMVQENAGEGNDTVRTALASHALAANVETLIGTAATGQSLTGNAGDNTIRGGEGNDTLDGGGGADTLIGGLGDDIYVQDGDDTIVEDANGGTDTLRTALASFSLTSVTNIENLTGTSAAGQTLTGNGGANVITGAGGNDVIDGGAGDDTMAGGGGNDLYTAESAGDAVVEGAGAGTDTVQTGLASFSIAGFANVENLTGTASTGQTLTGNSGNNVITGAAGNDVIDGGTGNDTMIGGLGDDSYTVDLAGDVITEVVGGGTDTLRTSRSALSLASYANVENLVGTANTGQSLVGNALTNTITGGSGNDGIDGGTGADTMIGGLGNDNYTVDNAGDVVTEAAGEGTDAIRTTLASFSLTNVANIENLTGLANTGQTLTGNAGANAITGGGGADRIDGGGGADAMTGGAGNDTYVVDAACDVVTEAAGAGTDTVETGLASYALGANVENLTGTAATGQALTGNASANALTGGAGDDVLDGGTGIDTMAGGLGNDGYVVRDAGDVVTEGAGAGTDSVISYIASYALGANVENLTGALATGQTLTGNGLANRIAGGTGADVMIGGLGDDVYVVNNVADDVVETAGEGVDTVEASVSYSLASRANVENITLTGSAAIGATGNAGVNILIGNSGANRLDGGAGADDLRGGLGDDTYVVEAGDTITELAGGGIDTIETALNWMLGEQFENLTLTGSANRNGTGNAAANVLTGNSGINRLAGGLGDDRYVVQNAGDTVVEASGEGYDIVESSVGFSLAGQFLEALVLTGSADINGTGNSQANALTGNSGANTLNGGAGADTMAGGLGNDRYFVDDAGDVVTEGASAGLDQVFSTIGYTLGANVEGLTLAGSAAINGTGNTLANTIVGNGGANILDGGAGADTLQGGAGDDGYVVDNAGDKVIEFDGEGSDTVNSSVTFSLAGQFVEVLNLTGSAAINGTGNSLGNRIVGNSASNTLFGLDGNDRLDGGGGADTMRGGLGNDVFVVDSAGDVVQENAGEGTDTVEASISYSLVGQFVESLKLMGAGNLNATGNGQVNELIGNAGNNVLNGNGGADVMRGGAGDDRFIIDNVGDQAIELNGEGYDTVEASVTFTLSGQYTDALTLTGSAAINGTGNSLANVLTGNGAANLLRGEGGNDVLHGGLGSDTLLGGAGQDQYWFETALGATNVDRIGDFVAADDGIYLDRTIFTGIAADGVLAAGAFRTGTAALDADDRILYDAATGNIWYDRDGAGGTAAVLFAQVSAGATVTAADFIAVP